jgi:hypothetical protein
MFDFDIQFPGGRVFSLSGQIDITFPGGEVTTGEGGTDINIPGVVVGSGDTFRTPFSSGGVNVTDTGTTVDLFGVFVSTEGGRTVINTPFFSGIF